MDENNTPDINFYSYYENLTIIESSNGIERIYSYPTIEDTEENICKNIATLSHFFAFLNKINLYLLLKIFV